MRNPSGSLSVFALVTLLGAASFGCGPSPDKVCDHLMGLAKKELLGSGRKVTDQEVQQQKDRCIADATKKKADDRSKWECEAKCAMNAATMRELDDCAKKCG